MSEHTYRTVDVPVSGGGVRAGVWDPIGAEGPVPTVPAIHGVTSSHLAWQVLVEQLPGVRVIAPDLRGRGASNAIEGPAGMTAHATDTIAVLDAFELEGVREVGHSMGGFVAVVLAHLHPQRNHPAFRDDWSEELERYIAYDLVPDGELLRPATSYQTTVEDTIDLNLCTALSEAVAAIANPPLVQSAIAAVGA